MEVTISQNSSVVDVALNLSGSLTGLPVVVSQLPVGTRVGFNDLPELWEDVADIGQTWTPDVQGLTLDLDVPLYNTLGREKAPYMTDVSGLSNLITAANYIYRLLYETLGLV